MEKVWNFVGNNFADGKIDCTLSGSSTTLAVGDAKIGFAFDYKSLGQKPFQKKVIIGLV